MGTLSNEKKFELEDICDLPIPLTGTVRLKKISKYVYLVMMQEGLQLTQHGGNFRLHSPDFAITISPEDAVWMIEEIQLIPSIHQVFSRLVFWRPD